MTGFGAADGTVGSARVTVDVRTVNHRFFNPAIKLPAEFARWEPEIREALRKRISRGHVSVSIRIDRAPASIAVDEKRFAAYVEILRSLRDRFHLAGEIDLATVLRMPDVVGASSDGDEASSADLLHTVDRAVDALDRARLEEGARLASVLLGRVSAIEEALARIAALAPGRLVAHRDRLRESVRQLAEGMAVDEQRLAQEVAILADRVDIQEELDRFRSHVAAFRGALAAGGAEGVGKRLGFLLQEMLREANTTGSKANDAAIVQHVLTIKEELERIREQVENLE
jgi:uncharacterized protein (TIGR00255 family)